PTLCQTCLSLCDRVNFRPAEVIKAVTEYDTDTIRVLSVGILLVSITASTTASSISAIGILYTSKRSFIQPDSSTVIFKSTLPRTECSAVPANRLIRSVPSGVGDNRSISSESRQPQNISGRVETMSRSFLGFILSSQIPRAPSFPHLPNQMFTPPLL